MSFDPTWTLELRHNLRHVLRNGHLSYDIQGGEICLAPAPGAAPHPRPPGQVLEWAGLRCSSFEMIPEDARQEKTLVKEFA